MASSELGTALTEVHRQRQLAIRAEALAEVLRLWPTLDLSDLERSFAPFSLSTQLLLDVFHRKSATTAADYYRALRRAEGPTGISIRAALRSSEIPRAQSSRALLATGPGTYYRSIGQGLSPEAAGARALAAVGGAVTRMSLDGGRQMIRQSVADDPGAAGYARVTDGNPCAFCAMLAGRGPVYSKETVLTSARGRKYHDRCGCALEPVFNRADYALPGRSQEFADLYSQSTRGLTGSRAINAFRRAHEGS